MATIRRIRGSVLRFKQVFCIIRPSSDTNSRQQANPMESVPELSTPPFGAAASYSADRREAAGRRPDGVVLQVDATVSGVDGLAWLAGRRDAVTATQLAELQQTAATQRWGWADLTRARLKLLRPRRAEVNELGAAYLAALVPGAAEAAQALRRAGVAISLASDVAAEALFGIATALGISPNELYAPRLRFDAIGAYVGCDLNTARMDDVLDATGSPAPAGSTRTTFVGTRRTAVFAPRLTDDFIAFSGVVAREGVTDGILTVATFPELIEVVLR